MDIRKSMEKKRVASAIEALTKGADRKGLQFPRGITLNSICYMDLIRELDEPTISKLSQILGVSKSAVTMKISELEKKDYVKKMISDEDKRVKFLSLTDSMMEIYDQFEIVDADIYKEISDQFSKEAIEGFCEILDFISDRIIDNIRK